MSPEPFEPPILARITAIIEEDINNGVATDIYGVAEKLQQFAPDLTRSELVALTELTVIALGGAAVWHKR